MAKTINKKSTEKRTYKHSDAWIKAHEEKLAKKQLAHKSAKCGHRMKTEVKNVAKNAALKKTAIKQKTKKIDNKKIAKQTTKKVNDKKDIKKQSKNIDVKKLNSLFEDAKKKNAAIKNTMKKMSEIISGILANSDQKTYDRLLKKLAFYGFTIVDGTITNTKTTVKVKLPKTKASTVKPSVDTDKTNTVKLVDEETVADETIDCDDADKNDPTADAEDNTTAESIPDVELLGEEHGDDEDDIEGEEEEDDDNDPEMEGLDDDEKAQLREDRRIAREYELGQRADSDDMIGDAMRENGDWD